MSDWVEVVDPLKQALWDGTHQGHECEPPNQMWRFPVHECLEMWVFRWEDDFEPVIRWRAKPDNWWYAPRDREDLRILHSLCAAKTYTMTMVQKHLPSTVLARWRETERRQDV